MSAAVVVCQPMYVYRLAFDPAFGRFSRGVLNTLDAIEIAATEGVETVEFLGGAERYKLDLSDRCSLSEHGCLSFGHGKCSGEHPSS